MDTTTVTLAQKTIKSIAWTNCTFKALIWNEPILGNDIRYHVTFSSFSFIFNHYKTWSKMYLKQNLEFLLDD